MRNKKWDIRRGYGVYRSVSTEMLQKWIKEGKVKKDEITIWTSGMSGWRRPEDFDEFKRLFEKKIKEKKIERKIKTPALKVKKKYPKVLIIDDEKDLCWLLHNYLRKNHYKVISANCGREGIYLVKKEDPDIVLLDLRLRDVDGLRVLHKIKQLWPKKKVIIISAFGNGIIKEKALRLGSSSFIDKPFNPREIIKAIRR